MYLCFVLEALQVPDKIRGHTVNGNDLFLAKKTKEYHSRGFFS